MLVADQNSNNVAVFSRNPSSGKLANEGKTVACPTPMCIVFVAMWGAPLDIKAVPA
jgi:6-phosphogluconolactonase